MKIQLTEKRIQLLTKAVLFACAITLIVQLLPRHGSFRYQFQIGKPWSYDLVTAPFNFPIYKDKDVYEKEQSAILTKLIPYYSIDGEVAKERIGSMLSPTNEHLRDIPQQYKTYLAKALANVYEQGIINSDDAAKMLDSGDSLVYVVDSNQISRKVNINQILTVKSAYSKIIKNRPKWANEEVLKTCNINYYLVDNLAFDNDLTQVAKTDLLEQVSLTEGMIQTGERIIDRGEIVTERSSALLNSLKIELDKQNNTKTEYSVMWIGEVMLIASLMMLLFLFLYLFRIHIYMNVKYILFLLLMILLMVSITSLTERFSLFNIYFIPFAILPIIIRTFFDSRTAVYVHIVCILLCSLIVEDSYEFILLQLTAGMTAVSGLKDLIQRSQLARAAILVFMSYAVIYIGYNLMIEGSIEKIAWYNLIYLGVSSVLLLFAYGLIYIFEKLFGFISNVSLVELSNVNTPLMQLFSETAPGTFQHSLQVANIATEAAKRINANALLVRVGALYHDIGKMSNPMFFTENQLSGINPLSNLDLEMASQTVISHVEEGVRIAERNNIPERIIEFITTHHGEGLTKYFYNSFKNQFPDKPINEEAFKYHGPSPRTKEQAILMMADAVEASSRSLKEYSDENIPALVDSIVDTIIAEGQLKYAKITFMDVENVKSVFKEKLKTIYHSRVSYPELKKK